MTLTDTNEYKTPSFNLIIPPPDIRNIIDRTADYIAKYGSEFESKIREKEANAEKFNFLNNNNPYHPYYVRRVKDAAEGKVEPTQLTVSVPTAMKLIQETPKAIQEAMDIKEPPSEFEFVVDAPTINSLELDIVKLTARYVARNGRQFLSQIMTREMRNYLFDFLKTQHNLFNYFTRLVEQYSKILLPDSDTLKTLKEESSNPTLFLKECNYRVAWEKHQARIRKRDLEIEDREKMAYAQIDWHDFVVVETVDQPINEVGNFPPLTLPEEVGARLIAEERGENVSIKWTEEKVEAVTKQEETTNEDLDEEELEDDMEVEDDMEMSDQEQDESAEESEDVASIPPPPPPPIFKQPQLAESAKSKITNPEEVIIKAYDPKLKQKRPTDEYFLISPLEDSKRIAPDQADKHIHVSLLNPEWKNERDRSLKKNAADETPYAPGNIVSQNLQSIADRRTDIFGLEETAIGKKVGEREKDVRSKYGVDVQPTANEAAIRRAKESTNKGHGTAENISGLLPPPPPPMPFPIPGQSGENIGPRIVPTMPHSNHPPVKIIVNNNLIEDQPPEKKAKQN